MTRDPRSATETVEALEDAARAAQDEGDGAVTVGDVLARFGERSYGPFLLVPALLEMTPVGSIPTVPSILALLIAIVAAQLFMGRWHVWLPGFLCRRSIRAARLLRIAQRLEGVAQGLDRRFHGRLQRFAGRPMQKLAAAAIVLLCLTIPVIEWIPLASNGPMLAIAAFGLAILIRDGLLMLLATVLTLAALGLGSYLLVTTDLVLPWG